MDIKHEKSGDKGGAFVAAQDGRNAGKMTYRKSGDSEITVDHTEVHDDFRGEGVGKKLLMNVVDYARTNNIKIVPQCPYVKSVFDKEPELRDVLQ